MKKIAFIINPISGTKNKSHLPEMIARYIDSTQWQHTIAETAYAGHAIELAQAFAAEGYEAVVAVGGDGTVNEVGQGLRDTHTALGIIPCGSGNGLANHLRIPHRWEEAIQLINHAEVRTADYGLMNGKYFGCTCGMGFDAYIADRFAKAGSRGLKTYLKFILGDFITYQRDTYRIHGEGIDTTERAFLITFANANQWGNQAIIAPQASLQDGQMDIALIQRIPLWHAPFMGLRLFLHRMHRDWFVKTLRAREVWVEREHEGPVHIDGEPLEMGKQIHIQIIENGLRVLVAKNS